MKRFALGDGDVPVVVDLVSDGEEERVRPESVECDWSDAETVVDETLPPRVDRREDAMTPPLLMEVNEGAEDVMESEEEEEDNDMNEDSDESEESSEEEDASEEKDASEEEDVVNDGEGVTVDGVEEMAVAADDGDLSSGSEDDDDIFVVSESSDDSGFRSGFQGSTVDWVDEVEYDGVSSSGDETASSGTALICSERKLQ
ncbi:acidic leucine-rich nuclear phosphoprotein 32 family member A-like [Microplitis demolitor]|uniref:acidic leucine-rich nuclear phosphoprotein 32 family member A-like n=1 Tax=Microplitis demolitor TaxID=69319 RepID=UPI0004CD19F7|nr:acidic leucine-rich nuclear phosphoprotein 32 family member A-like [Microplitis demolitor]